MFDDDSLLSEGPQGVEVVLTDPLGRVVSLGGVLPQTDRNTFSIPCPRASFLEKMLGLQG